MRNGLVGAAAAAALAVAVAAPSGITISPDKRPSARQILLSAAGATAKAASTGAYWRTQVVTGQRFLAPDRRYVIQRESTREIWLSQEYGKDRWEGQYLGAKPASPQDESAWRDAGAPTSWQFPADVTGLGRISPQALVRADPGIPQHGVHRVGWRDADGLLTKRVVSWKALRQIPSDPAALRAAITKIIRKENGTYIAREMEAELRTGCLEVISALPVSPETRASAYQILASMPGMRAEGQVTDPLGRTGQALSYQVVKGGKLTDERIVIDPASGLPLAQETTGAARAADGRQVDVGYFVAYQQIGWTDQRPTP